jgi:hypothetical protein
MSIDSVAVSRDELLVMAGSASAGNDASFLKSPFAETVVQVREQNGDEACASLLRETLASFLEKQTLAIERLNFPESVRGLITKEFGRIRTLTESGSSAEFDLREHSLRSDFRIAGFGRIPVGVEHMELSGVPRSLLYRGGISQGARFGRMLWHSGGVAPYYQTHMSHGVAPAHFGLVYTPRSQRKMLRNIAECLKLNPQVRGLLASSWWFDPELETISPGLGFLRRGFVESGAFLFRYGPPANDHATANSPQRKKLVEEGKYTPMTYTIVWPRKLMIRWADSSSD